MIYLLFLELSHPINNREIPTTTKIPLRKSTLSVVKEKCIATYNTIIIRPYILIYSLIS